MRDRILEIVSEIREDIDFEQEDRLIEDMILESMDIMMIVTALADEYGIKIAPRYLTAENFNSVDAIVELVKRLKEA